MLRVAAYLVALAAAGQAVAGNLPAKVQIAVDFFKDTCPKLENDPDATQITLENTGWVEGGEWSRDAIRDTRRWTHPLRRMGVSFQSYRFATGYFFECRVTTVPEDDLEFDPADVAAEFDLADGSVVKHASGRVTGIWQLKDRDFVSLNVLSGDGAVYLISMRTSTTPRARPN
jgi:hypothetical protein